ncbi:MAG: ABC transporter permease [Nitrospirota bacterium]
MLNRFLSFMKMIYVHRYMIKSFAFADLKKRYIGSFGGVFWSVIQPLAFILTYYVVFSYFFKSKVSAEYGTESYALWLIAGLLPWFFFSETVSRSTSAIFENQALVTKTLFPSEIIPISLLVSGIINHVIGLAIFFCFSIGITGGISAFSPLVLVYFVLLSVLVLGLSWGLSSLNVFMRDIGQFVTIALNLWFFYTPIFYPFGIIPKKLDFIFKLNPMYHAVEGYRDALVASKMPDPYHLLYLFLFASASFVVGGLIYKRLKPAFADVL